jgi:uncharacterized lipoprotein YmbA
MFHRYAVCVFLLVWGAFSGCASSPPSSFYKLNALTEPHQDLQDQVNEACLSIGIGPVTIPAYLDRSQIVTLQSKNKVQLADFHQWSEPLKDSIARVLAENLSKLLCTEYVVTFPWQGNRPIQFWISLDINHFEGTFGEQAQLSTRWVIHEGEDKKIIITKKSDYRKTIVGGSYEALVAVMSSLLEALSRDIARGIQSAL